MITYSQIIKHFLQETYSITENEKAEFLETIEKVVHLAERIEMYVILEENLESIFDGNEIAKNGLHIMLGGSSPHTGFYCMSNFIITSNLDDKKLFEALIILKGFVYIQFGAPPADIRNGLMSLLDINLETDKEFELYLSLDIDKNYFYSADRIDSIHNLLKKVNRYFKRSDKEEILSFIGELYSFCFILDDFYKLNYSYDKLQSYISTVINVQDFSFFMEVYEICSKTNQPELLFKSLHDLVVSKELPGLQLLKCIIIIEVALYCRLQNGVSVNEMNEIFASYIGVELSEELRASFNSAKILQILRKLENFLNN